MNANFGGYNPAQYTQRPGDAVSRFGDQLGSAIANAPRAIEDERKRREASDRRGHEESLKQDAFSAVSQFFSENNLGEIRPANKGETPEEYLTYLDNQVNAAAKNSGNSDIMLSKAIEFGERMGRNTEGLREERNRFELGDQLQDGQSSLAPQGPAPLSAGTPMDIPAMAGPPDNTQSAPLGAPAVPPQEQEQNRFAGAGPNYTAGFDDELRRLADDVGSGRVTSRDGTARRDVILDNRRKAQVAQEEFDFKRQEGRLDALRKDLFAARGKNKILRRDTREEISEFDSADMWDNPENFIIGPAIEQAADPLKQYDAETRRIAALNKGKGKGRESDSDNNPFAREWREITAAEERASQENRDLSPAERSHINSRRRYIAAGEQFYHQAAAAGDSVSVSEAKAMATNTIAAIDALRGLVERAGLQGDTSFRESWDYTQNSAIKRLPVEVRNIISAMYDSTDDIFEALNILEQQAGDVATPFNKSVATPPKKGGK